MASSQPRPREDSFAEAVWQSFDWLAQVKGRLAHGWAPGSLERSQLVAQQHWLDERARRLLRYMPAERWAEISTNMQATVLQKVRQAGETVLQGATPPVVNDLLRFAMSFEDGKSLRSLSRTSSFETPYPAGPPLPANIRRPSAPSNIEPALPPVEDPPRLRLSRHHHGYLPTQAVQPLQPAAASVLNLPWHEHYQPHPAQVMPGQPAQVAQAFIPPHPDTLDPYPLDSSTHYPVIHEGYVPMSSSPPPSPRAFSQPGGPPHSFAEEDLSHLHPSLRSLARAHRRIGLRTAKRLGTTCEAFQRGF
ncbi:hypothetical protein JCM10213_004500 [Rhodosporidiobolus nylandii]